MRKSIKLLAFLMSSVCLLDLNCVYATDLRVIGHGAGSGGGLDPDASALVAAFPVTIGTVKGVGGRADIPGHTLGFLGTRGLVDPDGQVLQVSRLSVAGTGVVVATPDGMTKDLSDRRTMRSFASLGGNLPGDIRIAEEVNCDEVLLYAYRDLTRLQKGLNDFATGQTAEDLNKLARAIRKLEPSDEFIAQAIGLFPPLIKMVKEKGNALARSLSADIPTILEALSQVVNHCEFYIRSRMDIATGVSLSQLAEVECMDFDATHVSLERVNITDIHAMFKQVEVTLNDMMRHRLNNKLDGIRTFLKNVDMLMHGGDGKPAPTHQSVHGPQIIEFSKMFAGDIAVAEFIDRKWVSPATPDFDSFKNGVKYINMLIESIKEYAERAQQIANGTYLEELDKHTGSGPSTALALRVPFDEALVVTGGADEARRRDLMRFMKEGATARMETTVLPGLQNTMEQIKKYLDSASGK